MRISDWSSDVCSSDLGQSLRINRASDVSPPVESRGSIPVSAWTAWEIFVLKPSGGVRNASPEIFAFNNALGAMADVVVLIHSNRAAHVSPAEHTSELQSLMRISNAVFCVINKP